jgi:hypothetical protein
MRAMSRASSNGATVSQRVLPVDLQHARDLVEPHGLCRCDRPIGSYDGGHRRQEPVLGLAVEARLHLPQHLTARARVHRQAMDHPGDVISTHVDTQVASEHGLHRGHLGRLDGPVGSCDVERGGHDRLCLGVGVLSGIVGFAPRRRPHRLDDADDQDGAPRAGVA